MSWLVMAMQPSVQFSELKYHSGYSSSMGVPCSMIMLPGRTPAWLARVEAASVRLSVGCSGSVVSAEGLTLTNDHCVTDCVQALSGGAHDYQKGGFLAAAQELGVPAEQAAVFEDALAGVEAGRAGGFGFVVGVDRAHQAEALRQHGASVTVDDIGDLL